MQIYRESSMNGNLLFISAGMRDVGTYQCSAQGESGAKSHSQSSLIMMAKQDMKDEEEEVL